MSSNQKQVTCITLWHIPAIRTLTFVNVG